MEQDFFDINEQEPPFKPPPPPPPVQPYNHPVVQPTPPPQAVKPSTQPVHQYPFLLPPAPKGQGPSPIQALYRTIVRTLDELVACIDTSHSEIVFDGFSCFADAVRDAVESIDGADLAVQAHWDHAVKILRMLGQTAYDLGCWAVPLHRALSETFFTIHRGLRLTDRQLGCEAGVRGATLMSMLAGVGRGLRALVSGKPDFFDYMGRKGGVVMGGMVEMLVAVV